MSRPVCRLVLLGSLFLTSLPIVAFAGREADPPPLPSPIVEGPGTPNQDAGRPVAADGVIPYVIVTDTSLAQAFEQLARVHENAGLTSRVRTLESIRAAYPAGRDDAERIRLFLKDARANWGTEFLLLGGDEPVIPMRRATLRLNPIIFGNPVLLLPTDQYYACLDGTWNADGDNDWGELPDPLSGDPGDDPDSVPKLCVGRAPVTSPDEARAFVSRTLRALRGTGQPGRFDVVLAASNFLMFPASLGPDITEGFRPTLEAVRGAHITRLYADTAEFAGATRITRERVLDALGQAPRLAVLIGPGGLGQFVVRDLPLFPDRSIVSDDILGLAGNDPAGLVIALSASTTTPGGGSIGKALLNADHGGAAAVIGPTSFELLETTNLYLRQLLQNAYAGSPTTIGEAMRANLRSFQPLANLTDLTRLTTLGNILLGDPALPVPVGGATHPTASLAAEETQGGAGDGSANFRLSVEPVPARESANLRLHLASGETDGTLHVDVLDVMGRRVRWLRRGPLGPGDFSISWDLRDDSGVRVPGGLYFVRVATDRARRVTRLAVL